MLMITVEETDKMMLINDSTNEILPRTLATPKCPRALAHLLYIITKSVCAKVNRLMHGT